jgi:hypothetical protein
MWIAPGETWGVGYTTLTHLRQECLSIQVQDLQRTEQELQAGLENKLAAIEQQLAQQNQQLLQASTEQALIEAFQQKHHSPFTIPIATVEPLPEKCLASNSAVVNSKNSSSPT